MDPATNTVYMTVSPFAGYTKLLSVGLGDVNGDGVPDIIVATRGQANGRIKVYDGAAALNGTPKVISRFRAFSNYAGGLTVASADVNGDGKADIIVGTGRGVVGRFAVFSGANLPSAQANANVAGTPLGNVVKPFGQSYTGGVNVAAGTMNGAGKAEVLASTATQETLFAGFTLSGATYGQTLGTTDANLGTSGLQIAALDVNGDQKDDIAVGALQGNQTVGVKIYNSAGVQQSPPGYSTTNGTGLFALGAIHLAGNTGDSLLVGAEPAAGAVVPANQAQISILDPLTGNQIANGFDAFATLTGGIALS
jgi:hypothetical protein